MGKKKKSSAAQINGSGAKEAMGSVQGLPRHLLSPVQTANAIRAMFSDEMRLKWLFEFANRDDLLELTPEQLIEQYARIYAFASKGQILSSEMLTAEAAYDQPIKARVFLFEIRETLRSGLRQVIELDSPHETGYVGWETDLDGAKRRVRRGRSAYQGPLRTMFLAAVADVIAEDKEKRFELCAKPTCKRFFWSVGGAKYCSKSCGDADRQKRYRTKEIA